MFFCYRKGDPCSIIGVTDPHVAVYVTLFICCFYSRALSGTISSIDILNTRLLVTAPICLTLLYQSDVLFNSIDFLNKLCSF